MSLLNFNFRFKCFMLWPVKRWEATGTIKTHLHLGILYVACWKRITAFPINSLNRFSNIHTVHRQDSNRLLQIEEKNVVFCSMLCASIRIHINSFFPSSNLYRKRRRKEKNFRQHHHAQSNKFEASSKTPNELKRKPIINFGQYELFHRAAHIHYTHTHVYGCAHSHLFGFIYCCLYLFPLSSRQCLCLSFETMTLKVINITWITAREYTLRVIEEPSVSWARTADKIT